MYSFKTLRIIVARAVHPRTAFFRMSAPCNFVSTQVLWRDYRANQSQGAAYLRTGLPQVHRPNLHRTDPGAGGLAAGLSSRRVLVRLRITGGQPLPKMLRAPNLFWGWVGSRRKRSARCDALLACTVPRFCELRKKRYLVGALPSPRFLPTPCYDAERFLKTPILCVH